MMLGMTLATFTSVHVALSLVGIASGFIVLIGMIGAKRLPALTAFFLATTLLTSLTGFLFPFKGLTPGIVIGTLSMIVLLLALVALYVKRLAGRWRGTYVISAVVALFFNFFVLIVQSFEKVPALKGLAPTQTEAPFKIAQLLALALFAVLTAVAYRKFRSA
jgi:hypothetical protein